MKGLIIGIGILILVLILVGMVIGISNREAVLRTTIEAKQKDNTSEYDNMWKKISQVAQVTQAQKEALKEIIVGYANARNTVQDSSNLIMNWIKEAVPNIDTTTFNNLQNIIVGSRDSFTMRQKELVDLSREHTTMLRTFPSGMILGFLGRKPIEIQIITSTRTEDAFRTGKDDDVSVFKP